MNVEAYVHETIYKMLTIVVVGFWKRYYLGDMETSDANEVRQD